MFWCFFAGRETFSQAQGRFSNEVFGVEMAAVRP